MAAPFSPEASRSDNEQAASGRSSRSKKRRWIALLAVLLMLAYAMTDVIDPFGGEPYIAIPHGDHVHYVPEDRNPDVPLSSFPTSKPRSDERITPTGQIVPVEDS
jgi:hypothetical protein